ncbi:MAG: DUF4249 domain-containing protein [Bacteroidales bacterium]|jgi:hypothetical protein|nr:DUF4249 domain-containing protein [Bacteroidales bacterium]
MNRSLIHSRLSFINTKIFPGICLLLWIAAGCEDMMTKTIEIDSADFPPKLAVSATLDTDGSLTMSLYEGCSVSSYSWQRSDRSIIANGAARLYRDDQLVWTLTGDFNLSLDKHSYSSGREEGYGYIRVTDIPAKAGSAYTLEIDMDGYEKAVSTVVMPADPLVDDVFLDMRHPVEKNRINHIAGSGSYWPLYPLKCTLKDNAGGADYYAVQIRTVQLSNHPDYPAYLSEEELGVGIANLTLIQDNPDYEALGSSLGDGESYDLYMFNTLLISDITFRDGSATLELFSGFPDEWDEWNTFPERPSNYTPEVYGDEVIYSYRTTLIVKHITDETFKHYRSLVLQGEGMGFFSEPVQIASNIQNGYGCFSLQNSCKIVLKEYRRYYYPFRY